MIVEENMTVEEKLRELKNIEGGIEDYQERKERRRNVILTDEIRDKLDENDKHFDSILSEMFESVRLLEESIKIAVLENKISVKGAYHAVYVKGRTTWDTKALKGYSLAHPEIKELRKTGKPSVRIKR